MEDAIIIIEDLQVWPEDLGKMTWGEALDAMAALGPNWRAPTLDEFKRILLPNVSKIPNVRASKWQLASYWSSTEYDLNNMYCFNFGETYIPAYVKTTPRYLLAVRDFNGNSAITYLFKDF